MRIYVASKFENFERVRAVQEQLRSVGHVITYDWTRCSMMSMEQAVSDMRGVCEAEALVLIVEDEKFVYRGALVEFGMALGRGIPVFMMGRAIDNNCIFTRLPHIHRGIQPLLARLS